MGAEDDDPQRNKAHWIAVEEAAELLNEERYVEALAALKAALLADSRNGYAYFFTGVALFECGQMEGARDAYRACLRVAEDVAARGPGDYPFRSGWLMSDRRIAVAVRDAFGGGVPVAPDSAPLANPLGWAPGVTFAEALTETLGWYREFARGGSGAPARAAA